MKQAHRQLPQTPRKKKAVLGKLVEDVGLPTSEEQARKKTGPLKVMKDLMKRSLILKTVMLSPGRHLVKKTRLFIAAEKSMERKKKSMYSPGICYCFGWKPMNLLSKRE